MLRNQVFLGSDEFIEKVQNYLDGDKELSEIPSSQRRPVPKPLEYYRRTSQDRNEAIKQAYQSGGYTLKAIGDHFGLHYSTVSGIVNDHKSKT